MKTIFLEFTHVQKHPKPIVKKMALVSEHDEPEFFAELIALFKKYSDSDHQDF